MYSIEIHLKVSCESYLTIFSSKEWDINQGDWSKSALVVRVIKEIQYSEMISLTTDGA